MIRRMLVFGATGDLFGRYLAPALAGLIEAGQLPDGFAVTGAARKDLDPDAFRDSVAEDLARYAPEVSEEARTKLVEGLDYAPTDVTDAGDVARAARTLGEEPILAYLALPPGLFPDTVRSLAGAGLAEGSRLVLEKPFGQDLQSARELNALLHESFPESAVFRADHFLGEQTVQNVLGLRFANRVFEPVWNREHVERVEIVWDETLALEGRAGYYDSAGALKDMVQSHLLQLLALVAMEPPATLGEQDFRDRKVEVFRNVKAPSGPEAEKKTVRARYTAGEVEGSEVPAYVEEEGVEPDRSTETFAEVTLEVENPRWSGVPFTLRSGKALGRDRREISVHFRPAERLAFGRNTEDPEPNVLRLGMDPDTMSLDINVNGPGDLFTLERVGLDAELAPQRPSEYGRLLLAALGGGSMLSIRGDEAEECWRIVEPVLRAWREDAVPLLEYPAGSEGPVGKDPQQKRGDRT